MLIVKETHISMAIVYFLIVLKFNEAKCIIRIQHFMRAVNEILRDILYNAIL